MIKYVVYILALFVLLIIQGGILSHIGLGEIGNLLLVFTIVAVILSDFTESLTIAMISGFMLDLVSGPRDGTFILCFLACLGFTYLFINKFVPREPNRLILFSCIALNTIIFFLCFVLVNKILIFLHLDIGMDWRYLLSKKLLIDLVANLILAYPTYLFYIGTQRIIKRLA